MKITRFKSCRGSVLLMAAGAAAVLAILIAGYLTYQTNEYNFNYRAHRWNQALHLSESALELGIAEFNYQYTQGSAGFQSSNGWTSLGGGSYSKTVSNLTSTTGNVVGTFTVTASGIGASNPTFLGIGTISSHIFGGTSIARATQVILSGSSGLFQYGILTKSRLTMPGAVTIDSYDSSNPAKSTNGQYDSSKRQANGNIATLSTAANAGTLNAVYLANSADVYGTIALGTGGSITFSGSPAMGPTFSGQATTVAAGVSSGWITSTFNSVPPDVTLPASLSSGAVNEGTISLSSSGSMTINSGNYQATALSVVGNSCLTINGNVSMYITGNVAIKNSGSINITAGSSLTVYMAGASADFEGAGIINNGLRSENNQWYGLPTMNTGTIANSGVFNGTLYAPEASVTISGAGSLSGALVASSITLAGSGAIHFDESLKNAGGSSGNGYNVVSWQELRNVNGSWVP